MVKINKNKFLRYYKVQKAGTMNMYDLIKVMKSTRLTKGAIIEIQSNYRRYCSKYLEEEV